MAWASQGGAGGNRLNRIDYTFSYDPAKVEVRRDGRSGYTQIRYEGLEPFAPENAPGSPLLPAFHARVLLPPDRKVADLVVLTLDPVGVGGRNIVPIPSGGADDTDGATEPDPFYYEEHHPYPPTPEILLGDGGYRELAIADVAVLPFAWDPARQELILYRTVEVSLLLEPRDESDGCPPRLRPGMKFSRGRAEVRWAREHLLNPEDLPEFYPESEEESEGDEDPWEDRAGTHSVTDTTAATGFHPTDRPSLEGSPVEMVILTNRGRWDGSGEGADMTAPFRWWADWRTKTGVPTVVRTLDWLRANYTGGDDPERIRAFLRDAYSLWGTDYLLLGGDVEIVPARMTGPRLPQYGDDPASREYPSAWYYAALAGEWGSLTYPYYSNEGLDLYPELWVGRIPARDSVEADAIVKKMASYERMPGYDNPAPPASFYTKAVLIAGLTNFGGWQAEDDYAGIGPADLWFRDGLWQAEKLRENVLQPAGFTSYRLYPKLEGTKSCGGSGTLPCYKSIRDYFTQNGPFEAYFTTSNVYAALKNEHPGVVFHVEHSNRHNLGGLSDQLGQIGPSRDVCFETQTCSDCDAWKNSCFQQYLTDNPEQEAFGREILSSLSNGPSYFVGLSYGSGTGSYDLDSVDETLVRDPDGGAVAFCGKISSTNLYGDPDEFMDLSSSFFKECILDREPVGAALANGLVTKADDIANRTWHLFGDPSLRAWSAEPRSLNLASNIARLGTPDFYDFRFTVHDAYDVPVPGVQVCASRGHDVYVLGITDPHGEVRFPSVLISQSLTGIDVWATADNCLPSHFFIQPANYNDLVDSPALVYERHTADDVLNPGPIADVFEAGDRVRVSVELRNVTFAQLPAGTARIEATPRIRAALLADGLPVDTASIRIGARGAPPPAGRDTFAISINEYGIRPEGQPPAAESVSAFLVWRDVGSFDYHLRVNYIPGDARAAFSGALIVDGGLDVVSGIGLEQDDTYEVRQGTDADTLVFAFQKDAATDEVVLHASAQDWLIWSVQEATYEAVGPNGTTSCVFILDLDPLLPPRKRINFTVATRLNEVGNPAPACSDFYLETAAPEVAFDYHTAGALAGLSLCHCEAGTVLCGLWPWLWNSGNGLADSVEVILTPAGNGYFLCSGGFEEWVTVPAGASASTAPFEFCDTGVPGTLRVDKYEVRRWINGVAHTLLVEDPVAPWDPWPVAGAPSGVRADAAPNGFRVTWGDVPGVTEIGWNVYVDSAGVVRKVTPRMLQEAAQAHLVDLPHVDLGGSPISYRVGVSAVSTDRVEGPIQWTGVTRTNLAPREGWPKRVPKGTARTAMLVNLDADADLEVLTGGRILSAWNPDGTSMRPSHPDGFFYDPFPDAFVDDDRYLYFFGDLAADDLDGDGITEVAGSYGDGKLYVVHYLSALDVATTQFFPKVTGARSTPTIADLLGTGSKQVLVNSYASNTLYVFNANGSSFKSGSPGGVYASVSGSTYNYAGLAVGNLRSDVPGLEIVHPRANGLVNVWRASTSGPGSALWSSGPCDSPPCGGAISTPVIADMNNDSEPDIVVAIGDTLTWRRVAVLQGTGPSAGCTLYGWRGRKDGLDYNAYHEVWTSRTATQPPAVAELNPAGNGAPEVVMGRWARPEAAPIYDILDKRITCASLLSWRGTPPSPCQYAMGHITTMTDSIPIPGRNREYQGATFGNPILADIDGDGKVEALLGGNHGGVFAWELTPAAGDTMLVQQEKGWPLLFGEVPATPAVADVDGDGFLELVVAVDDGWVYLYDLPGLETGSVPWPAAARDNARTGDLGNYTGASRGEPPREDPASLVQAGDIMVSPNPFQPATRIRYRAPSDVEVEMAIYDVAGRRVRQLFRGRRAAGIHEVEWNGRTDQGHPVPSGVYLLRGKIGAFEQSRRIVVAR